MNDLNTSRKLLLSTLTHSSRRNDQVQEFIRHFDDYVDMTEALAVKMYDVFDWEWFAENALSPAALEVFNVVCDAAFAEYSKIRDPLMAVFNDVCYAAFIEYKKTNDPKALHKIRGDASTAYHKARRPALNVLDKARALAFATLYINDEG